MGCFPSLPTPLNRWCRDCLLATAVGECQYCNNPLEFGKKLYPSAPSMASRDWGEKLVSYLTLLDLRVLGACCRDNRMFLVANQFTIKQQVQLRLEHAGLPNLRSWLGSCPGSKIVGSFLLHTIQSLITRKEVKRIARFSMNVGDAKWEEKNEVKENRYSVRLLPWSVGEIDINARNNEYYWWLRDKFLALGYTASAEIVTSMSRRTRCAKLGWIDIDLITYYGKPPLGDFLFLRNTDDGQRVAMQNPDSIARQQSSHEPTTDDRKESWARIEKYTGRGFKIIVTNTNPPRIMTFADVTTPPPLLANNVPAHYVHRG